MFSEDGHEVRTYALENAELPEGVGRANTLRAALTGAGCIVLPVPMCRGEKILNTPLSDELIMLSELLGEVERNGLMFAGALTEQVAETVGAAGMRITDYMKDEALAVANAIPTVEGAIQAAFERMETTLHRANCLVIGFGRIGKLLGYRLRAMGAYVTVAARKYTDRAWIEAYDYTALPLDDLAVVLPGCDVVFNTAPSLVLDRERLKALKKGSLVIDLASKPGGVDFGAASELGVECVHALSLPGKVAPATAARVIRDTIYRLIAEEK